MAFRNIFRNRRRSLLTGLMMIVGFVLVSISLSMVEAIYGDIITMFTGQSTGHVQVVNKEFADNPSLYKTIKHYKKEITKLEGDHRVQAIAPRIYSGALGINKNKTLGVEVVGIDPGYEAEATHYGSRIKKGSPFVISSQDSAEDEPVYNAIIGKSVAKILELNLGEELILISQGADGSIANDLFKIKAIIGTDEAGKDDYRVYLPLNTAAEFYSLYNQAHEISVQLESYKEARDFSSTYKIEDPLVVRPWQVVEADFFKAMEMDKEGNNVTLFILMLMVGVTVLNTILMSTLERTKEFGVLKAIGTLPKSLFTSILYEGIVLAVISSIIGAVLSLGINYYLRINGIELDEPISFAGMMFSEYKTVVSFDSIFFPVLIIIGTSVLACLYPGYKASRIGIAKALREFKNWI